MAKYSPQPETPRTMNTKVPVANRGGSSTPARPARPPASPQQIMGGAFSGLHNLFKMQNPQPPGPAAMLGGIGGPRVNPSPAGPQVGALMGAPMMGGGMPPAGMQPGLRPIPQAGGAMMGQPPSVMAPQHRQQLMDLIMRMQGGGGMA